MKKALISKIEPRNTGFRVAQVEPESKIFEVAEDFEWVDCPDDVVADQFWYDPKTKQFKTTIEIPAKRVPQVVSMFQGRAALAQAGLLANVDQYMQAQPADSLARIAWEYAQEFRRESPTVLKMGEALGMDAEALDNLFIFAATIKA